MPERFNQAIRYLPPRFRDCLSRLTDEQRSRVEEVRLRAAFPLTLSADGRELTPDAGENVSGRDVEQVLESVSGGSVHTVLEALRHGYITVEGGHRVGVCGTAAIKDGALHHMRDPSSLCIRIAREKKGAAVKVLPGILAGGRLQNTLILSPPGAGKTTLLRDLIRLISTGSPALAAQRVAVADERSEIAACHNGVPQLDVGTHTDVWTGLGKAEAAMLLLRGFSPQVLAMDELSAPEDIRAAELCAGCGTTLLSTAHASGLDDLWRRPLYRPLAEIFSRIVVIGTVGASRSYHIQEVQEICKVS